MLDGKLSLKGKRALVCGGSKGLGFASAKAIASLGAEVILLSRKRENLEIALASLPGSGHSVIEADLSKVESLIQALDRNAALLSRPVHILVNNSGGPPGGPIIEATVDDFRAPFESHLLCSHALVQRMLPCMISEKYGRVLNIISTSVKQPIPGLGVSNSIRGAMAGWAKTLSIEVAKHGVTVNNILPGATTTERLSEIVQAKSLKLGLSLSVVEEEMRKEIPMGRFGEPDEFGAVVAFLASPAASYVSGVSIPVDGGRTGAI